MYSIRSRLNLTIICGMVIVLAVTAVFLYFLIARQVEAVFDSALYDKAQAMIALTEMEDDASIEFEFAEDGLMPEFHRGEAAQYYQIWDDASAYTLRSPSLGEAELPRANLSTGQHRIADLRLVDGRAGRMIAIVFLPRVEQEEGAWEAAEIGDDEWEPETPPEARPILLSLARERESLNATLLTIGLTIAGVIVGMILLSGLMI